MTTPVTLSLTKLCWVFVFIQSCLLFTTSAVVLANDERAPLKISLKKGARLSLIAPLPKAGAEKLVQTYLQQAFPLSKQFGAISHGPIPIEKTLVGRYAPPSFSFFSWPNAASEVAFTEHADWPGIKALRPKAWDELKIFTSEVSQDTKLTFSPTKYYTVAIAWFNPERPNDYVTYLNNIENSLQNFGGRFFYKMTNISYERHASEQTAPNQITLVEWDSADVLQRLQADEEYQQYVALLERRIVDFELHLLHL